MVSGRTTEERHHPIFSRFQPWQGPVEGGWDVNWLGVKTRSDYYSIIDVPSAARLVLPPLPPVDDEEYFEWIDLLEAVTNASGRFTMIELGAGYGRWTANAAAAVRQRGMMPYRLVAVEAEPQHFRWLRQHLADNDVDPGSVRLIHAAIAPYSGRAPFTVGRARDYYGQAVAEKVRSPRAWVERRREAARAGFRLKRVRAVALRDLISKLDLVDLVDADIQGAEADVFEAARDELRVRVRRVHVETHGAEQDARVEGLFRALGWRQVYGYPSSSTVTTEWGPTRFEGGVQSWINPEL